MAGDSAGVYSIPEVVGEGGFGCVSRAEHLTLGGVVALKELVQTRIAEADSPKAMADFECESRKEAKATQ